MLLLHAQRFIRIFACPPFKKCTADKNRSEHRGDNSETEGNCEAAYRTCSELVKDNRGDNGGDVGVDNGNARTAETGMNGFRRAHAQTQFLAYSFKNQHVGVNSHADSQHDPCDSRKGEGCAEHGKSCKQKGQCSA